jgi:hypothetical protein
VNIKRYLKQRAVYWAPAGSDMTGAQLYDDPVEVKCRWEDVHELFYNEQGEETVSNAKVLLDILPGGAEFQLLGVLWLAPDKDNPALPQLTDEDSPLANPGAAPIRRFDKFPDRLAKTFLRTALL